MSDVNPPFALRGFAPGAPDGLPTPAGAASAALPRLLIGAQLAGRISGTATDGTPLVSTPVGLLALQGADRLPAGVRVLLDIVATEPGLRATLRILPEGGGGDRGMPGASASAAPSAAPLAVLVPQPARTSIGATTAASPQADPEAPLLATVLTPLAWTDDARGGEQIPTRAEIAATPLQPNGQAVAAAVRERILQPGTQVPVRLNGPDANETGAKGTGVDPVVRPTSAGEPPSVFGPSARMPGVVAAALPDGRAIVCVDRGAFVLPAAARLAAGDVVTVSVVGLPRLSPVSEPNASASLVPAQLEPLLADGAWQSLTAIPTRWIGGTPVAAGQVATQASQTLLQNPETPVVGAPLERTVTTDAARNALHAALPRLDANFGTNIRSFFAALQSKDLRSWLGDSTVTRLRSDAPDLLARVADDFDDVAKTAAKTSTDGWSTANIPIAVGDAILPVRLLFRQRPGAGRTASGEKDDRRFVLDVSLSRLGRVQLDTLVRGNGSHLDLIVRSDVPLTAAARDDIREVMRATGGQSGIAGSVGFQSAPAGFAEAQLCEPGTSTGLVV
ncbi:MAG: hypothetical protein IPK66_04595 [Rhodospirillales bacterium]|nr:hypothetical protein [Rhodospirillales bacterium]